MTQIYHETNRKFVSYHFLVSSSLSILPTQTNEALDYQFIQGLVQINSSFTIRENLLHPFSLFIYSCVFFYPHKQQSELSNGLYKAILPVQGVVKTLEKFSGVLPIYHDGYYATALKKKVLGLPVQEMIHFSPIVIVHVISQLIFKSFTSWKHSIKSGNSCDVA